jgi:hypothetical protein
MAEDAEPAALGGNLVTIPTTGDLDWAVPPVKSITVIRVIYPYFKAFYREQARNGRSTGASTRSPGTRAALDMHPPALSSQATPPTGVGDASHRTGAKNCHHEDADEKAVGEDVAEAGLVPTFDAKEYDQVDCHDGTGDQATESPDREVDSPAGPFSGHRFILPWMP